MDFGLTHHLTRADEELVAKCSQEKAFLSGGNSSCCYHAHQHYELYKKLCKEANIPEYHWAIPQDIWMEMESTKADIPTTHDILNHLHNQFVEWL